MSSADAEEALLAHIDEQRGVEFRDCRPSSLRRRPGKRLRATGAADYGEYRDRLMEPVALEGTA